MSQQCSCGPEERQKRVLMVRRLHPSVTMPVLLQTFGIYGAVTGCKVFTHKSGRSAGCASIEFSTHAAACAALRSLNNTVLHGKAVQLAWYNPEYTSSLQAASTMNMGDVHEALSALSLAGGSPLQLGMAAALAAEQQRQQLPLELQLQQLQQQHQAASNAAAAAAAAAATMQLQFQQQQQQSNQQAGDMYAAAAAALSQQAAALASPHGSMMHAPPSPLGLSVEQQQLAAAAAAAMGFRAPLLPHQQAALLSAQLPLGITPQQMLALQLAHAEQQQQAPQQHMLESQQQQQPYASSPSPLLQKPMQDYGLPPLGAQPQQQHSQHRPPPGRLPSPLPPGVPRTSSAAALHGSMPHTPRPAGALQRMSADGAAPGLLGGPRGSGGWPPSDFAPLAAERAASLPLPHMHAHHPHQSPYGGGGGVPAGLPMPMQQRGRSRSQQSLADQAMAPHAQDQGAQAVAAASYMALCGLQQPGHEAPAMAPVAAAGEIQRAAAAAAAAAAGGGGSSMPQPFALRPQQLMAENLHHLQHQQISRHAADVLQALGPLSAAPRPMADASGASPPLPRGRSTPSPGGQGAPTSGSCAAAAAAAAGVPGLQPMWSPSRVQQGAPAGTAVGGGAGELDAVSQRGADSPRDAYKRKQLFKLQQQQAGGGAGCTLRIVLPDDAAGPDAASLSTPLSAPLPSSAGAGAAAFCGPAPPRGAPVLGGRAPGGRDDGGRAPGGGGTPSGSSVATAMAASAAMGTAAMGALKSFQFAEDLGYEGGCAPGEPLISTEVVPDSPAMPIMMATGTPPTSLVAAAAAAALQPALGGAGVGASAAASAEQVALAAAAARFCERAAAMRADSTGTGGTSREGPGSFSLWAATMPLAPCVGSRSASDGGAAGHWPAQRAEAQPPLPPAGNAPATGAAGLTRHSSICLDACVEKAEQMLDRHQGEVEEQQQQMTQPPAGPQGQLPGRDVSISHAFQMPSFFAQAAAAAPAGEAAPAPGAGRLPLRPATAEPLTSAAIGCLTPDRARRRMQRHPSMTRHDRET